MPMMPYTKKPIVSYLLYTLYAVIMAASYGLFTYFGIFARGADGFALRTYIWNLVLITLVLLIDRLYLRKLKKNADEFIDQFIKDKKQMRELAES